MARASLAPITNSDNDASHEIKERRGISVVQTPEKDICLGHNLSVVANSVL